MYCLGSASKSQEGGY